MVLFKFISSRVRYIVQFTVLELKLLCASFFVNSYICDIPGAWSCIIQPYCPVILHFQRHNRNTMELDNKSIQKDECSVIIVMNAKR